MRHLDQEVEHDKLTEGNFDIAFSISDVYGEMFNLPEYFAFKLSS
jgi:hypothetical protein